MAGRNVAFAAVALMIMGLYGCAEKNPSAIIPDGLGLRPGDVVLRRGGGFTSRAVLFADAGGQYSHVGMVVDSAGTMMIVHAVPGEPDYAGDPDRVKMERPSVYYGSDRADIGCVMRCADSAAARRAADAAMRVYRRGTLFDHDYDDSDTTLMYCCELVEFAYTAAGQPLLDARRHDISIPGLRLGHVILPSDFCRSQALRRVAEF